MKVTKYLCDRCRRPIAEDEVCEIRDYQHIDIIHPELLDIQLCPECEEKVFQAMKAEISAGEVPDISPEEELAHEAESAQSPSTTEDTTPSSENGSSADLEPKEDPEPAPKEPGGPSPTKQPKASKKESAKSSAHENKALNSLAAELAKNSGTGEAPKKRGRKSSVDWARADELRAQGMTYTEAAKMLGVPYSTIYNHYSA